MFVLHCWLCYYRFSYYVGLGFVFCISWFFTFFSILVNRLAGKSVPGMTWFVSSGMLNINLIIQSRADNTVIKYGMWTPIIVRLVALLCSVYFTLLLYFCTKKISFILLAAARLLWSEFVWFHILLNTKYQCLVRYWRNYGKLDTTKAKICQ